MRVGVIDVGSNTIRLLVAEVHAGTLDVVHEDRAWAQLGGDVARTGGISALRLGIACEAVGEFAAAARRLGCSRVEVLVASPGRQALNAGDLVRGLERTSRARVRVLGREEEALLAYHGAVGCAATGEELVAVCDVGGGSTQIAAGSPELGAVWLRSVDIGSLRLTAAALGKGSPGKKAVAKARTLVHEAFDGLAPPLPATALAVGGSARAVRRIVGPALGEDELQQAVSTLRKRSPGEIAATFDIGAERARTLLAGSLILSEVQLRLMIPLRVVSAGLREGAVYELAGALAAA
jgi:exopolyphosphatase / guanosine-5'-triphosphate,3'-diphosphate pyrophosphatase